jgi:WD40 repeat protein
VAWAANNQLVIYNLESKKLELDVDSQDAGHSDTIRSLAFSPRGDKIVTAGEDKKVFVWERTSEGWKIACMHLHAKKIMSVEFLSNTEIIFGDKFGDFFKILISNNSLGTPELMFGHLAAVSAALHSKSRSLLISADRDEKIRLTEFPKFWNVASFLFGHRRYVSGLCFYNAEETKLVSAGADGLVALWDISDIQSPRQLWSLQLEDGPVNSMTVKSDGEVLLVRTDDAKNILHIHDGVVVESTSVDRDIQSVIGLPNNQTAVVDDMSNFLILDREHVKIAKEIPGVPVSLMKFVHHENLDGAEYGERKRQKHIDE